MQAGEVINRPEEAIEPSENHLLVDLQGSAVLQGAK